MNDSDHRSRFCPARSFDTALQLGLCKPCGVMGWGRAQCRAKENGCEEAHPEHFCRVCKNRDSAHRTRFCPQIAWKKSLKTH